jgi:mannan endo-1,4-beta-mannosidase
MKARLLAAGALALLLCAAGCSAAQVRPVRDMPVDSQANTRTKSIYAWLRSDWGKKVIAGQQDLTWKDSVDMAQRVFDDTGKYPALMGFDFMNTGQTGPKAQGVHQVDEASAWSRRGGLVAFMRTARLAPATQAASGPASSTIHSSTGRRSTTIPM